MIVRVLSKSKIFNCLSQKHAGLGLAALFAAFGGLPPPQGGLGGSSAGAPSRGLSSGALGGGRHPRELLAKVTARSAARGSADVIDEKYLRFND